VGVCFCFFGASARLRVYRYFGSVLCSFWLKIARVHCISLLIYETSTHSPKKKKKKIVITFMFGPSLYGHLTSQGNIETCWKSHLG
jgi:hypothetical protein